MRKSAFVKFHTQVYNININILRGLACTILLKLAAETEKR